MKNPIAIVFVIFCILISLGEFKKAEAGDEGIEGFLKFLELFFALGAEEGFAVGAESFSDFDDSYMFGCVLEAGVTGFGMTLSYGYSMHKDIGEGMYFGMGLKYSLGDLIEDYIGSSLNRLAGIDENDVKNSVKYERDLFVFPAFGIRMMLITGRRTFLFQEDAEGVLAFDCYFEIRMIFFDLAMLSVQFGKRFITQEELKDNIFGQVTLGYITLD